MKFFNWEILRKMPSAEPTREGCIKRAFDQYVDGNDFGELSSPELQQLYEVFRSGWIICESFFKGG